MQRVIESLFDPSEYEIVLNARKTANLDKSIKIEDSIFVADDGM